MYCQKCGTLNDDNAYKCVRCAEPLHEASPPVQKIPNYLAQSILVTVLCCVPLGIPAIVFSAQVNGKIQAGDIEGAKAASRKAKIWGWWAFGSGLVVGILYFLLTIAAEV
jgi:uncharacterized membrane protein YvbJ